MKTTTEQTTASTFGSFLCSTLWGRGRVRSLNATMWSIRAENLVRDVERAAGETIAFEWNNVAYGLVRVVVTGRVNGETTLRIQAMSMRQLAELMFILNKNCGSIEEYAGFLMKQGANA